MFTDVEVVFAKELIELWEWVLMERCREGARLKQRKLLPRAVTLSPMTDQERRTALQWFTCQELQWAIQEAFDI